MPGSHVAAVQMHAFCASTDGLQTVLLIVPPEIMLHGFVDAHSHQDCTVAVTDQLLFEWT